MRDTFARRAAFRIDGTWTTAEVDKFPDGSFLFISPGGSLDGDGRTTPRSLRHFPYRDGSGALDLDHLRDAIGRIPQSDAPGLTEAKKSELQAHARKLLADAESKKSDHADVAHGVYRFDVSELHPLRTTAEGWGIGDGFIGRSGLLTYIRDGKPWVEYRPPEEAFNQDSLDSFDLVPLTNDHPPPNPRLNGARILDAENTSRYAVGLVASPRQDGEMVRAKIRITDAAALEDLKRGRSQLSCGYLADVDPTPGVTPDGRRYDAIQRNVRGNHVALVSQGRAGPSARVRVDSLESEPVASTHGQGDLAMKTKVKVDGIEYEVECSDASFSQAFSRHEKAHADEVAKLRTDAAEASAKSKADLDKATARADAADAAVKAKADELAKAPEKIKAEIAARSKLVATGVEILGQDAKVDEMTDVQLRGAVISAVMPEAKLDGKSDAYVEAMFDAAVSMAGRSAIERGSGPAFSRADAKVKPEDDEDEDEAKRDAFQKASREAAKGKKKTSPKDIEDDED